jgi:hypothetical protein
MKEVQAMAAQANGLVWEASLDQAKARSRKEGKPILLDFSAAPM